MDSIWTSFLRGYDNDGDLNRIEFSWGQHLYQRKNVRDSPVI